MPISTELRIDELIDLLLRRTSEGHLKWQPTADEDTFRLASRTANVRITRRDWYDPGDEVTRVTRCLSILNDHARVVEEHFADALPQSAKFDALYTEARRSAHNTDEVLSRLMDELRSGKS